MDPEEKRKQLEREILLIIAEKLQSGDMEMSRAQQIAQMLLNALHPPMTLEQIYAVAPTLDDQFSELAKAVLPFMKKNDDKIRETVVKHAEELIRSGQIKKADSILKQALSMKGESNG